MRQAEAALASQEATGKKQGDPRCWLGAEQELHQIVAPVEGYVTKKTVEKGNLVSVGTPLLALVPLNDVWVVPAIERLRSRT